MLSGNAGWTGGPDSRSNGLDRQEEVAGPIRVNRRRTRGHFRNDGMELVREQPTDVPGPFVDSPAEEIEYQPEESDKRWIEWDDG